MAGRQERWTKKGNFRRVGQMREGLGLERDRDLETQGSVTEEKADRYGGQGQGQGGRRDRLWDGMDHTDTFCQHPPGKASQCT